MHACRRALASEHAFISAQCAARQAAHTHLALQGTPHHATSAAHASARSQTDIHVQLTTPGVRPPTYTSRCVLLVAVAALFACCSSTMWRACNCCSCHIRICRWGGWTQESASDTHTVLARLTDTHRAGREAANVHLALRFIGALRALCLLLKHQVARLQLLQLPRAYLQARARASKQGGVPAALRPNCYPMARARGCACQRGLL